MSSSSVNKVILVGNLGKHPDIRTMQNGKEMANFSIATSESWIDKSSGMKTEKTEWHNIVIFNEGLVKVVKDYVRKGSKVYVEGALRTRKWVDSNSNDRYVTEVVLQGFNSVFLILDSRNVSCDDVNTVYDKADHHKSDPDKADPDNDIECLLIDDEIPF